MSESDTLKMLWRWSVPEKQVKPEGHHHGVKDVAVTSDGRYILSISAQDRVLIVWDLRSGEPIKSLKLHYNPYSKIRAIAASPDSRYTIVGYDDVFYMLDLQNWSAQRVEKDTHLDCDVIAITPDSRYALLGNAFDFQAKAFVIRVYDVQGLEIVRNLAGHGPDAGEVQDIVVSPDGRRAMSAASNTIKVWDLESGQEVLTLRDASAIRALALTPDGRFLLSGSGDRAIKIWDCITGAKVGQFPSGHIQGITDLAVTPDGIYAVSSSGDGGLKIWDWQRQTLTQTCAGHTGSVNAIAITADGRHVVSASSDRAVRQWDIQTGKPLSMPPPASTITSPLAITPDDRFVIACYGRDPTTLGVWDMHSGELGHTLAGHSGDVTAVDFTDDGAWLVSASADHTLRLWDLRTGETIRALVGHSGRVQMTRVIRSSGQAISGAEDGLIKTWDLRTGREVAQVGFRLPERYMFHPFAASSDGRYAIVGIESHVSYSTFKIWNLHTQEEWLLEQMRNVVIAPDNRHAIFGTFDSAFLVWDLRTGRAGHRLVGHKTPRLITDMVCSADSQYLISEARDDTLRVWNLQTGQAVHTFTSSSRPSFPLAITADSRYAVSSEQGSTVVKVWELQTGLEIASCSLDAGIRTIVVSHDGQTAIANGGNGELYCLQLRVNRN
jgi:WD40 repeat protein